MDVGRFRWLRPPLGRTVDTLIQQTKGRDIKRRKPGPPTRLLSDPFKGERYPPNYRLPVFTLRVRVLCPSFRYPRTIGCTLIFISFFGGVGMGLCA